MDISVSCTTRNKRKYEIDGVHYSFISEKNFQEMIDENKFLEYENVHGDLYGTPLDSLKGYLEENKSLFLELDVKGALSLKKIYPSNTISIFLSPPNIDELRTRLVNRSTESDQ